ncbi:C-type lectin lectoxin-Lio3-like [Babylonia areolata]|uniref:C-type lectin lectoxin-Lio3-like n=1 Tax=Babylonia areolata TaxID=304850 RepID=UPI003FD5A76E
MFGAAQVGIFLTVVVTGVHSLQYELYREAMTWDDARDTCSRANQRLVHVTEKLEHTRIHNYRLYIFDDFWIGLKKHVNSEFQWTDAKVPKFTAWGRDQPDNQSACVSYSAANFLWETHNCSDLLYFMCENDVSRTKVSGRDTMMKGLALGFGSILGTFFFFLLLLQMGCCRLNTVKLMGHFGLGRGL